jgi:hypothetical protein
MDTAAVKYSWSFKPPASSSSPTQPPERLKSFASRSPLPSRSFSSSSIPPSPSIPLAPLPPSLELCTPKQAWQTTALILVPLIFNQLGAVMSPQSSSSSSASSTLHGHDYHHHPHQLHQHLHLQHHSPQSHSFVTLASILERSPLFFVFLSSWWVDMVVLVALIVLLRYMAVAGGNGVTPAFEVTRACVRVCGGACAVCAVVCVLTSGCVRTRRERMRS